MHFRFVFFSDNDSRAFWAESKAHARALAAEQFPNWYRFYQI
jgi:hypothetical protein